MKQTQACAISSIPSNDSAQVKYFTVGNMFFDVDVNYSNQNSPILRPSNSSISNSFFCGSPSSSHFEMSNLSEEGHYQVLMKLKQKLQPVSCIQYNNKCNQLEATILQEKSASQFNQYEQQELFYEFQAKRPQLSQTLERYFALRNQTSSFNYLDQSSDSCISSINTTQKVQQDTKEKVFFQFCNQEIAKLNDLNGQQQFFSYTVVQCLEDELTPFIYKMGFSESFISILGSSRNNFQQMLMRSGSYLPFHSEVRLRYNMSIIESLLLCHDQIHENKNFHCYTENCQLETFERLFFNCVINKYVIPCVYGGALLGFIVLDLYTIPNQVIKGLLSRRKQANCQLVPIFPEDYKQKSEVFLQKIKRYSS
ncbi:hypothetical protein ABPG74_007164 [Tetrahymena malaccensis]